MGEEQRRAEAAVRAAQLARLARDLRLLRQRRAISGAIAACNAVLEGAVKAIAVAFGVATASIRRQLEPMMDAIAVPHAADPELMHIFGGLGPGECQYCPVHRARHAADIVAFHDRHGIEAGHCWWCREARARPVPLAARPPRR